MRALAGRATRPKDDRRRAGRLPLGPDREDSRLIDYGAASTDATGTASIITRTLNEPIRAVPGRFGCPRGRRPAVQKYEDCVELQAPSRPSRRTLSHAPRPPARLRVPRSLLPDLLRCSRRGDHGRPHSPEPEVSAVRKRKRCSTVPAPRSIAKGPVPDGSGVGPLGWRFWGGSRPTRGAPGNAVAFSVSVRSAWVHDGC